MSGLDSLNKDSQELVNFYSGKVGANEPTQRKNVEKVLSALIKRNKMLSERKKIKEGYVQDLIAKHNPPKDSSSPKSREIPDTVSSDRGTYKKDMGKDLGEPDATQRVTGDPEQKGVEYQKLGIKDWNKLSATPGIKKLMDDIASSSGVDREMVSKILQMVFNNGQLAADKEIFKQLKSSPEQTAEKPSETGESGDDSMLTKLTQRQSYGGDDFPTAFAENKKHKLQESVTLDRWKKLAGIKG